MGEAEAALAQPQATAGFGSAPTRHRHATSAGCGRLWGHSKVWVRQKKSGGGGEDTSQLILLSLRHSLGFLESFFLLADPAPFSCPAGETSSRPPWAS